MWKRFTGKLFRRSEPGTYSAFAKQFGEKPDFITKDAKESTRNGIFLWVALAIPFLAFPLYIKQWMIHDQENGDWRVKELLDRMENKKKKREHKELHQVSTPTGKSTHYKYILVGGGTASYAALQAIRSLDPNAKVLILSRENHLPYDRTPLSKELWKDSSRNVFYDKNTYSNNVTVMTGVDATTLDVTQQKVSLQDGRDFTYDKILLATGGSPRILPGQEEFPNQIMSFRTLDDFGQLHKDVLDGKAKDITIIGGSFLGTELAFALSHYTKGRITQVYLEPEILSRNLPRYLAKEVSRELERVGVKLEPNSNVTGVSKSGSKVVLTLDNGTKIPSDYVITCMGIYPETTLAENGGLEIDSKNGGIVTNAELEAIHNVYVAGDVLSYHDIVLGRRRSEHHLHALATGKRAGLNMAGESKPFQDLTVLWSEHGDIHWQALGELDSRLNTYAVWNGVSIKQNGSLWAAAPATPITSGLKNGVVYYLRDAKVVGVLLWNVKGKVVDAKKIISEKKTFVDLEELRSKIVVE
jgi:programmed cell death 8 (apoptosis-inducing factor)